MTTTKMKDAHLALGDRIQAAIERIKTGQGQMRVPVEATDPDVVLADCLAELDAARARERHALVAGTTERNAADARLAEVEAERDESEAQVESLRAQLDQQAQRYNAALDRLIADKDQLSLAGSHLRAQLAAVQSATPEAVTRELERGRYSIIRAWLALHGGTSAQIAVEEMAQLVRSFGEPLTLKEPKA